MAAATAVSVGVLEIPAADDLAHLLAGVSRFERERYRTLGRRPRARQYLTSRWLLRIHLGTELGLQPLDVPLRDADNGPPVVPGTGYRVGLSHSHDACLCIASAQGCVGCDVEWHRPNQQTRAIATQYFHAQEAAALNGVADAAAAQDFYRLWTLKEATQKALGHGIAGGLRSPAFALEPTLRCLHAPPPGPWTFASTAFGDASNRYTMALAIGSMTAPARFRVKNYTTTLNAAAQCHDFDWQIATADQSVVDNG